MKITIEEINGVKHTVVWHDTDKVAPFDVGDKRGIQFTMQHNTGVIAISTLRYDWIATALPPLPRQPTAKDAALLHAYAAHELDVHGTYYDAFVLRDGEADGLLILRLIHVARKVTITHATHNGERVEIAIRGDV
jgi:hypothetical protein